MGTMNVMKTQLPAEPVPNAVLGDIQKDVKKGRYMLAAAVAVTVFFLAAMVALQLFAIQATKELRIEAGDDSLHVAGSHRVVRTKNYDFDLSEDGLAVTRDGRAVSMAPPPTENVVLEYSMTNEDLDGVKSLVIESDEAEVSLNVLGWGRIKEESTLVFMTPEGNVEVQDGEFSFPETMASFLAEFGLETEEVEEVVGAKRGLLSARSTVLNLGAVHKHYTLASQSELLGKMTMDKRKEDRSLMAEYVAR